MSTPIIPVADPTEKPTYDDVLESIRVLNPDLGGGELRKFAGPAFQAAKSVWNVKQGDAYKNDPRYRKALRTEGRRLGAQRHTPQVIAAARAAYDELGASE